ncbi:MAG: HIT domain-containing protein [Chloroflexota bacterium]
MSYILNPQEEGCAFCNAIAHRPDGPENLIVYRSQRAFVILNRYPYNSGHLMVVPYKHCPSLDGLDPETRAEMMELTNDCVQLLQTEHNAQGINIGINIGNAAGAGIPQHIHLHIVPRWTGDANFISTIGETRVVPEALEETYTRIWESWERVKREA